MRHHLLFTLTALLGTVLCEPGALEDRAVLKTTTTTSKTSSTTTAKTTSSTPLTTSKSASASQASDVPTTIVTVLNAAQSASVQAASAQIQAAARAPQCGITGGRLLSAYFQTNQSSFSVPAQCGALCRSQALCRSYAIETGGYCRLYFLPVISVLQTKLPGNNTYYDRACASSTSMCQVNGFRSPFSKSYMSSTKLQDNNWKGCNALCTSSSGCQAFSIQLGLGGACQLYKKPLYQDFFPDSRNLNIYWDLSCPRNVPGAANAGPTLTPYIPPTPVPSIANASQAVTFASFVTPTPLTTNDPPLPSSPQQTPDDDNIFVQTYTYEQYQLPDVVSTGSPPITTGLAQPSGTDLPSAPCMVSAGPQAQFTVINDNYIPMVSRTGSVGPLLQPTVAPAANDPILNPETLVLPPFYFQAASGSSNVYDLVYAASSPQYVAMHSNGSVLLTSSSTGPSFVNNLVTSIFSFDCYGRISMNQGGSSYNWVTKGAVSSFVKGANTNNMKALPVNIPAVQAARKNRRQYREMGEKLRKRSDSDGPAPKCPAAPPGLYAGTKQGYVQGEGNFCDNLSDYWQLSPYDFDGSCAVQSACYDSCEHFGWVSCNAIFGTMMIASCWSEFDGWWEVISAIACTVQASYFTGVAATSTGRDLFYKAQKSMCRCFCSSPPNTCAYSETNFYCADLYHGKDNNNCGACGRICGPKSACHDGGVCGCPQDQCGTTCLDFRNNPNNCGSCGNVCNPSYCVGGQCYAPKPGQCAPDQGISNGDFEDWSNGLVDWNIAAYPGCSLGDKINFTPTAYTGANGQTIDAVLVEMTNLPGSGCQAALSQINAKMCSGITYELTFTMGAVGQVGGQNVNDDADCSVYWSTGPPGSPGNNGAYQTSPTYTIKGNSQTFQTFGPWGPIHVAQGDPGVEMHHGNLYVNMTAVISCGNAPGKSGYFIMADVELNPVGTAKARDLTSIGEIDAGIPVARDNNSTNFNVTEALQPYVPQHPGVVVVSSLEPKNVTSR